MKRDKPKKQITAEKYLHLVADLYPEYPQEKGFKECPCTKKCSIKGNCRLCAAYHARKNKLPECER